MISDILDVLLTRNTSCYIVPIVGYITYIVIAKILLDKFITPPNIYA